MNQTIGVNITPQSPQPTLHYSQGDVGRVFVVNVTDYDIPTGATVTCVATKPSGMGFTVSGTVSGNSVTFTSTAEMTDEWGRFPAEIRIASGNTLLGTANFLMIGEKDPHPASTIDGTQEELIPQLTLLVNRVEAAAESVHDLTISATTLAAGSDATATYDSANNSIAFGIPKGADGDVTRSDFNDLKSDLTAYNVVTLKDLPHGYGNWAANGSINSGSSVYTIRSTVGFFLNKGDTIELLDNSANYSVSFADINGLNASSAGWVAFGTIFTAPNDGYAKVNMRKRSQGAIASDEIDSLASLLKIRINYFNKTGFKSIADIQSIVEKNQNGVTFFNSADFKNGNLSSGNFSESSVNWRIATPNIISFPYKVKIKADTGFSFGVHYFNDDDTFTLDSGWKTELTIVANQKFKIVMRYTQESAGVIGYVVGLVDLLISHFTVSTEIGNTFEIANALKGNLANSVLNLEAGCSYYWQDNTLLHSPAQDVCSTPAKIFMPKDSTIQVDDGYKYKFYLYDTNGAITSHTNSWQIGSARVFVATEDCYALICMSSTDGTVLTPEQMIEHISVNVAVSFDDYKKINQLERYVGLAGDYNYVLAGKSVNFKKTKYRVDAIDYLMSTPVSDVSGATSNQGFAINNGVIFQMFSDNKVELIDIATKTSIGILDITSGHGDTIDFSDEYYDASDEFPLAYITADTTPAKVYVNRITRTGCTLIKTYTFPLEKTGYYAGHCLDVLNNYIYQVGYAEETYNTNPDGNNHMIVSVWDLGNCTDEGNNVYTPAFIRSFTVPFMVTTQGQTFFDNKLVLMSSDYSNPDTNIYFIDLGSQSISSVISDLPSNLKNVECEGIAIVETDTGYDMIIKPNSRGYYRARFA
jgi:hypothetical protein